MKETTIYNDPMNLTHLPYPPCHYFKHRPALDHTHATSVKRKMGKEVARWLFVQRSPQAGQPTHPSNLPFKSL